MRRTTQATITTPTTPYNLGPKLVDDQGDSVTDPTNDAVRVALVSGTDSALSDLKGVLDESLYELRRIRTTNEIILGQEVEI